MYEILDSGLARIGEVEKVSSDNHSLHWKSAGTLTLIAAATEGNLRELRNDRFVLIRDTFRQGDRLDGLYVICSVQHDEEQNELIVNGKAAPYLLHRRAMQDRVLASTTAGAALAGIVNESARGLPIQADFVSTGNPAVIRYPMEGGAVDERCEELMSYCGIGMDAVLDSGKIRLTYSAGRDISTEASVPVLGKDSGWARNTSLTVDDSDHYNVAIETLAFSDGREESFILGDTAAQGTDRRELHIGEIAQKNGESDGEFRARAAAQAEATLAARLLRTTINADISPADYGRPYLVGDLVRVQVGPVTIKKRITAATWLFDQSNDKISLTLGDQLNTVVAEIREQEKVNASKVSSASARAGGAAKTAAENKEAIVGIKSDFKALISQVDGIVAGMDAYVLEKVFEDYKIASARLFAALGEEDENIKSELSLQATSIEGLQETSADLTTRVSGAETALEMVSQDVGDLQEASAEITARVDLAETSLQQKAEKSVVDDLDGRVKTVETAQESLGTRVDDAETALDQKAEKTAVEDLDGRVDAVETAQASLTTRVSGAETALEMQSKSIGDLQTAVTSLETRAGNAESALEQKADSKTVTKLSGKVSTIESAQNSLTARVDGAEASLKLKASQDEVTGISSSVATLEADVIKLRGDTEIVGNLSIEDGLLKVNKGIRTNQDVYANKFHSISPSIFFGGDDSKSITLNAKCQINPDGVVIGSNTYQATQITSTTGAVLALGIA